MKHTSPKYRFNFMPLFLFAVAMGFLEAIVVLYVRDLYYPDGFNFPLKIMPPEFILIEIIREFCTLVMLGSVAWAVRDVFVRRLSVFLFLFGIWDIFYYVALKFFLDWPETLLTWDILFLIPITWVGPVLAPIICSVLMILMAFIFEYYSSKGKLEFIELKKMLLILAGAFIIYITFTLDFGLIILKGNYLSSLLVINENPNFIKELGSFIPSHFQWEAFTVGILLIILGIAFIVKNIVKKASK